MKIQYPTLKTPLTIGVTAPSSGVEQHLHLLITEAEKQLIQRGMKVIIGNTTWTQLKGRSTTKEKRVSELMDYLLDERIDVVMPPWGGSFLMELLPLIDWDELKKAGPKWILGYSDISTLSFVYTTMTGYASAHGVNFTELSAPQWDELSSKWIDVITCKTGHTITQSSSHYFQSSWEQVYKNPATGFYFDSETEWKVLNQERSNRMTGRLIGGCLNTLQILIGTPFDYVQSFINEYCSEEGTIWYLESVGMDAAKIYRALWQLKYNGWFNKCNGVLIGRAGLYENLGDFTLVDALGDIFDEMGIPVFYEVDIGHVPPQLILVNGAVGEVIVEEGRGTLKMQFS